jgi:hypothetical protein
MERKEGASNLPVTTNHVIKRTKSSTNKSEGQICFKRYLVPKKIWGTPTKPGEGISLSTHQIHFSALLFMLCRKCRHQTQRGGSRLNKARDW